MRRVVGLIGPVGSGKTSAANFLERRGFAHFSLSDILREIAAPLGLSDDRDTLIMIGNTLREKFGPDILARGVLRKVEETRRDVVIDSIRHPLEVALLKQELDALIVGITVAPERAWDFVKERGRQGDPRTYEEFLKAFERDMGIGQESHGLQVGRSLEMADITVENRWSRLELEIEVEDRIMRHFSAEGARRRKEF